MSDIIATGTSGYETGSIDTATVLVNDVSPRRAEHVNGCASAVVQVEHILGQGTTLKGATSDLATRLSIALANTGTILLTGFSGLITDRGLTAVSPTQLQVMNHTPIGVLAPFSGSSPPVNWLLANGQSVSRTVYSKLFAVCGTTYGVGDGSTTFNVPDLQGRTIIMVDGAANRITAASTNGANADTLGGVGGAETHTLVTSEMPAHTHTSNLGDNTGAGSLEFLNAAAVGHSQHVLGTTGGGVAHSNTQPWMALNYIIFAGI